MLFVPGKAVVTLPALVVRVASVAGTQATGGDRLVVDERLIPAA